MAAQLIFASTEEEATDIRSLADLQHTPCEVFISTNEAPCNVANKEVYLGRDSALPLHLLAKACSVFLHTGSKLLAYTVSTRSCPGCGDPSGPCPNQSCVRTDPREEGNPAE